MLNQASSYQSGTMPVQRNLKFNLPPDRIADWNTMGGHVSHMLNTLSLFFPVGERYFISSVRNYREQVTEPQLQQAVKAFIGQEAMHGREHDEYNDALYARVPVAKSMEKLVASALDFSRKLPKSWQLSDTIALEHFTAILADALLSDSRLLEGAEPHFKRLWIWHALEETEHKSVAFDVWRQVKGRGLFEYIQRSAGLLMATLGFILLVIPFYLVVLQRERQLFNLRGWQSLFRVLFGDIGILRKAIGPWASYFRPSFHPWDHDNRHYLARLDELMLDMN